MDTGSDTIPFSLADGALLDVSFKGVLADLQLAEASYGVNYPPACDCRRSRASSQGKKRSSESGGSWHLCTWSAVQG